MVNKMAIVQLPILTEAFHEENQLLFRKRSTQLQKKLNDCTDRHFTCSITIELIERFDDLLLRRASHYCAPYRVVLEEQNCRDEPELIILPETKQLEPMSQNGYKELSQQKTSTVTALLEGLTSRIIP